VYTGLPYFSMRPSPTYQRLVGESVTLVCEAGGNPQPRVSWIKVSRFRRSSDAAAADAGAARLGLDASVVAAACQPRYVR